MPIVLGETTISLTLDEAKSLRNALCGRFGIPKASELTAAPSRAAATSRKRKPIDSDREAPKAPEPVQDVTEVTEVTDAADADGPSQPFGPLSLRLELADMGIRYPGSWQNLDPVRIWMDAIDEVPAGADLDVLEDYVLHIAPTSGQIMELGKYARAIAGVSTPPIRATEILVRWLKSSNGIGKVINDALAEIDHIAEAASA